MTVMWWSDKTGCTNPAHCHLTHDPNAVRWPGEKFEGYGERSLRWF